MADTSGARRGWAGALKYICLGGNLELRINRLLSTFGYYNSYNFLGMSHCVTSYIFTPRTTPLCRRADTPTAERDYAIHVAHQTLKRGDAETI